MPQFSRYIGIDYSGAETPDSSCKGIRVFTADGADEPKQIQPPPSPRRYWTRRGLAEWLYEELTADTPTIVGIDHAFSFPLAYFERYRLSSDWQGFLEDFQHHWPTEHIRLLHSGKFEEDRRTNVVAANRTMDSCRKIRFRVRRKWRGCHVHRCWSALAPLP